MYGTKWAAATAVLPDEVRLAVPRVREEECQAARGGTGVEAEETAAAGEEVVVEAEADSWVRRARAKPGLAVVGVVSWSGVEAKAGLSAWDTHSCRELFAGENVADSASGLVLPWGEWGRVMERLRVEAEEGGRAERKEDARSWGTAAAATAAGSPSVVGEAVGGVAACAAGVATCETGEAEEAERLCAAVVVVAGPGDRGGVGVRARDIETLRRRAWPLSILALKLADCSLPLTLVREVLLDWPEGERIWDAPWPRVGRLEVDGEGVVVAERFGTPCATAVSGMP